MTKSDINQDASRSREYRLLFLSALIGVIGGLGAQLFVWLLNWGERLLLHGIAGYAIPEPGVMDPLPVVGPQGLWLIPVATTLGGLLSGFLVYTFASEAEGHGTDAAVEAFHFKGGRIRPIVPLIKAIASAITIGSGGAAGREGPTAQISVGVGSILADLARLTDEERRILVLAGMAAGLAAIFRSPLGMAIFAVEILYAGMAYESEALIYTVIASVVAYAVNGLFVGWDPIFLLSEAPHFTNPVNLVGYSLLGIVAGLIGAIEPPIFYGIRDFFKTPAYFEPCEACHRRLAHGTARYGRSPDAFERLRLGAKSDDGWLRWLVPNITCARQDPGDVPNDLFWWVWRGFWTERFHWRYGGCLGGVRC
jgi:CIC family chloride channel protein